MKLDDLESQGLIGTEIETDPSSILEICWIFERQKSSEFLKHGSSFQFNQVWKSGFDYTRIVKCDAEFFRDCRKSPDDEL
jgi:hypothetical protein